MSTAPQRGLISRRNVLLGVAGLGAAALAGCVQGSASRTAGTGLSLWISFSSDDQRSYYQDTFVETFNEGHPDYPLTLTVRGDQDSLQRLQRTAIASGSGPDLIFTPGPSYGLEFVDAERFMPLDEYVDDLGWQERLLPWAYDAGSVDGHLYMVPFTYETMIMVYNKRVFEEHGWVPPTTREEFESYASAAQSAGVMPVAIGSYDWKPTTEHLVSIFFNHAAGSEVIAGALRGEIPWTDARIVDSIQLLSDYFDRGWMGGGAQAYFTNRESELWTGIANGTAGIYMIGSWAFAAMMPYFNTDAGNYADWDWAPLPAFGGPETADLYALGIGETYSISVDAPRPDVAAGYIDLMLSRADLQMQALNDVQAQPIPLVYTDSDYPPELDDRIRRLYDSVAAASRIGYLTWTFWPPRSGVYIYEQMDRVITGQMSAAEYCAGLDSVFQEELALGKVPPTPDSLVAS